MDTYVFLQQYWWFVVSILGAFLVFLLFVQGGDSMLFCLGKTEEQQKMMMNSTGRKCEFTFTTLVTFGGAFFASFPLFYSTSFGGAYWLWMIILFSFVLQAVSYEFQSKAGNLLGRTTYRVFLVLNGIIGPVLLGVPWLPSSPVRLSISIRAMWRKPLCRPSVNGPAQGMASMLCSIPGM